VASVFPTLSRGHRRFDPLHRAGFNPSVAAIFRSPDVEDPKFTLDCDITKLHAGLKLLGISTGWSKEVTIRHAPSAFRLQVSRARIPSRRRRPDGYPVRPPGPQHRRMSRVDPRLGARIDPPTRRGMSKNPAHREPDGVCGYPNPSKSDSAGGMPARCAIGARESSRLIGSRLEAI
jgi:hypothetical protein